MKKLYIFLFAITCVGTIVAQPIIRVEVDIRNHLNDGNNITGCVLEPDDNPYKMYIHSGMCSATTTAVPAAIDCQDPNFVWEHVVGDWGMDNGYGEMTETSDSIWTIDIDVATYYSNPATISQGGQSGSGASVIMPAGSTPLSMGFVFRDQDGTIGGLSGGCTDFFIFNLDQGNTSVDVGLPGNTLPDSTFGVQATGINDIVSVSFKSTYPNPFKEQVKIVYDVKERNEDVSVKIYNSMGQIVRDLYDGSLTPGTLAFIWDGNNNNGAEVPEGVYYYVLSDGSSQKNRKTN